MGAGRGPIRSARPVLSPLLLLLVLLLVQLRGGSNGLTSNSSNSSSNSIVTTTSTTVSTTNSKSTLITTSTITSTTTATITSTTTSTTTATTPLSGSSSSSPGCPDMCLCASEPLPALPAAAGLRPRPAKLMACLGLPPPDQLTVTTEVLRVFNSTTRRLDFWSLRRAPGLLLLDASCNGVTEVSGSGKAVPRLRALDLTANSLHVLQTFAFRDFPELRVLNLSANGLHSVAPSAFALPQLAVLDLRHNRLAVLRAHFFWDAPRLREVYLSDNALSRVPAFVFPGSLDVLDLSGNHIVRVEEAAFDGVTISQRLDLGRNALRRVPNAALKRLGAVQDLVLSDNPLGALGPGAVSGLAARNLHLQRIRALSTVHRGAFVGLPELRELRLSANADLTYLHPRSLDGVPVLDTLDLSGTALFTLERQLLESAPSLRTLRLDNGTLLCHCSLGWLRPLSGPVSCRAPEPDAGPQQLPTGDAGEGALGDCAPYIIPLFPLEYSETLGNNASFHCRALGGSDLKVTWWAKDGARLVEDQCSGRLCVRDHVLTVLYLHAEDAGTYTCTARSEAGSDRRAVALRVRDVHVRLLPLTVTSTFVTLAWNMSSAVTNSYTLRVEEVALPGTARSVTFTVGLKMHSYTVHGLKPRSQYAFTLAIQREAYTLVIGSTVVTTREGAFLVSLGIERSYLSIILVSVLGGASAAGCLGVCGLRCWRQRLRLRQAAALRKSNSAFSGREMLPQSPQRPGTASPGAHSALFGGITYISLNDERALAESDRTMEQDLISFT